MRKVKLLLLAVVAALLFSCKPEPTPAPVDPSDTTSVEIKGVFVLNEGVYQFSNGSLSFYDPEADTAANNLFYKANGVPVGDVAQSLALAEGKLYIVVNSSNYIYKVDANTLKCDLSSTFQLTGFYSPREMQVVAPNKAYVSDLIGKGLWIINPQDMTHCGFVETGKTTEKIVQVGNELYVSNWSNYYFPSMEKNTVQVVDINNDVKVAEITVGKEPNTMVVDKNRHV
jgi:DNA-binding beta-propeller fold protein YncE